ncbi:preprotein translocase subunit SecY [Candidatus Oleimmundimicrobium sp.]|uniref:preprotein translocase subunit SecY n=1 Tax=Candidatus Oleimmundimicrobium sp. TaxID=3060597 RepID=UPI002723A986|nr:preprotein translocase subunit SecY [Candidatus Oleimmundimicrobium sp.]MDO8886043.1 preprotein translocase subunit SecY [Candidatus Oleimmundimicrobium sp.]
MIKGLLNAFKVPELRKRILATLLIIAIYRFGCFVPVPGIDVGIIKELFNQFTQKGSMFGFMDIFAGGALSNFAVFALGIMPYITAAIIMQLLTIVIPKLEEWSKEGESGQRKITQWTRYMTLGLAIVQSMATTVFIERQLKLGLSMMDKFLIIMTLVAGTVLIMWLGELITQHGIGNGMSLIITVSILSRFPEAVIQTLQVVSPYLIVLLIVVILVVFLAIVVMEMGQRRIPVQYAKRVVGRKMYGGQSTYIPLKINQSGVIPIIFAASVLMFPATIAQFFPTKTFEAISNFLVPTSPVYMTIYGLLIIFFSYFYTAVTFNPIDIADNIKKYGGFIPGVRPGKPTAVYLDHILNRITLPGSFFLALVALLPTVIMATLNVPFFKHFGGISLLIIVGVSLETVQQLESQLLMRHYEGFLK